MRYLTPIEKLVICKAIETEHMGCKFTAGVIWGEKCCAFRHFRANIEMENTDSMIVNIPKLPIIYHTRAFVPKWRHPPRRRLEISLQSQFAEMVGDETKATTIRRGGNPLNMMTNYHTIHAVEDQLYCSSEIGWTTSRAKKRECSYS